jgi:ABC-type lipoprotein export system ATPase subunit
MDLLVDLNGRNGQTFVIVTHSDEVAALAHRIVRMTDGRIATDGSHDSSDSGQEGGRG